MANFQNFIEYHELLGLKAGELLIIPDWSTAGRPSGGDLEANLIGINTDITSYPILEWYDGTTWRQVGGDGNNYSTGVTFTSGTLAIQRDGLSDISVSLDGRYLQSYTETDPVFTSSFVSGITSIGTGLDLTAGVLSSLGVTADNGLTASTATNIQLGQDVGAIGNPATLLNDREIPMNQNGLTFSEGKVTISKSFSPDDYPLIVENNTPGAWSVAKFVGDVAQLEIHTNAAIGSAYGSLIVFHNGQVKNAVGYDGPNDHVFVCDVRNTPLATFEVNGSGVGGFWTGSRNWFFGPGGTDDGNKVQVKGTISSTSLKTGSAAPITSGTTKMVITDANGLLSFSDIPSSLPSLSQYHLYVGDASSAPVDAGSNLTYDGTTFKAKGATASTNKVLDVQNSAGTSLFTVKGQGNLYTDAIVAVNGNSEVNVSALSLQNLGGGIGGFNVGFTNSMNLALELNGTASNNLPTWSSTNNSQAFYVNGDAYSTAAPSFTFSHNRPSTLGSTLMQLKGTDGQTGLLLDIEKNTGGTYSSVFNVTGAGIINIGTSPTAYSSGGYDVLVRNQTSGNVEKATITTPPAGSNTQIQYNNSGAFGASSNFLWLNSTSRLEVVGDIYSHSTLANSAIGGQAGYFSKQFTWSSDPGVWTSGGGFAGTISYCQETFGANIALSAATIHSAQINFMRLGTSAAAAVTVPAAGIGSKRAISANGVMVQMDTQSSNTYASTIEHVAGVQVFAPQALSTGVATDLLPTFTNYYGLLLAASDEYSNSGAKITNKWGVYQVGANDKNVFAGMASFGHSNAATSAVDITSSSGATQLRLRTSFTPTSSADTAGNIGDHAWDDNYVYVKTSAGWKRSALSTF